MALTRANQPETAVRYLPSLLCTHLFSYIRMKVSVESLWHKHALVQLLPFRHIMHKILCRDDGMRTKVH